MRDGVELATDLYLGEGVGVRPAVLIRVPYSKDLSLSLAEITRFVGAGYHFVAQDVRGSFASEGQFTPFVNERLDGEDAIRWVSTQEWCDGRVATIGASYLGAAQWLAASGDVPGLKAIAPNITGGNYYEGWTYQGGAFQLGFTMTWTLSVLVLSEVARGLGRGTHTPEQFQDVVTAVDNLGALFELAPVGEVDVLREHAPYYLDWLDHPANDEYWRKLNPSERYGQINVPALNIGGWYDVFLAGTLANYRGMRESDGTDAARQSRLIIGPWAHGVDGGDFPWCSFGLLANAALLDLVGLQIRFFDHYVRGIENGVDTERPVKIFVMGANAWRDEEDWPLPDTTYTPLYLVSSGRANTATGDGRLSWEASTEQNSDHLLYDPRNPVPTVGGQTFLPGPLVAKNSGPRDRGPVQERSDVLCYTTPPLERDTEVIGPVSVTLHASSTAVDTDFTAALVDVHPDGTTGLLTDGILRTRYRGGTDEAAPMVPGHVYELTLDLVATANVFRAGHRIRLEVSSSNFPRFDRNSNTGGDLAKATVADYKPALNSVHHGPDRCSRLMLPIIRR
jgi:putative CocE/NonD family hydrolase